MADSPLEVKAREVLALVCEQRACSREAGEVREGYSSFPVSIGTAITAMLAFAREVAPDLINLTPATDKTAKPGQMAGDLAAPCKVVEPVSTKPPVRTISPDQMAGVDGEGTPLNGREARRTRALSEIREMALGWTDIFPDAETALLTIAGTADGALEPTP